MTTVGEAEPVISVRVVEPVLGTVVGGELLAVDGVAVDPVAPLELTAASVPWGVPVASVAAEVVSGCVVANATAGTATAVPIPSTIARAPVRPMYLAHRVLANAVEGAGMLTGREARLGPADSFAELFSCITTGLLTRIDLHL